MYGDSCKKKSLGVWKNPLDRVNSLGGDRAKFPSGELHVTKKGDKLYIRPLSPYRYNSTPEIKEHFRSDSGESWLEREVQCHQRSVTTIINEIPQSYTFVPAIKKTQLDINDEDSISNSSHEHSNDDYKDSIVASTIDPKSFLRKPNPFQVRVSTIMTISSTSSEKPPPNDLLSPKRDKHNSQENRNSILEPVKAFCQKCGQNTTTEVIENVYVGSL